MKPPVEGLNNPKPYKTQEVHWAPSFDSRALSSQGLAAQSARWAPRNSLRISLLLYDDDGDHDGDDGDHDDDDGDDDGLLLSVLLLTVLPLFLLFLHRTAPC